MEAGRAAAPAGSAAGRIVAAMSSTALDAALAVARRQVETGVVPWVVLGTTGAEGRARIEAVPPLSGPRIGTNAVCLLASITKPIVATAVLRLAQEGRFNLTAPLSSWLPELDAAGLAPFTAWHVLTHTSGIADFDLETLLRDGGDREELLRRTVAGGQATPPGSTFRYASFTFDLLAEAVERAVGHPFAQVLHETVLGPLGMADTTFDPVVHAARRAPIAVGSWDGSQRLAGGAAATEELVRAYASLRLAGGGLWSTAHDLLLFGRAMLRGGELDGTRVVGRPLVDLMTREVTVNGLGATPDRLTNEHYAIGWGKPGAASPASPLAFGHGGVSGTRLWIDPAYDLAYVYLTGQWGGARVAIDDVELALYGAVE